MSLIKRQSLFRPKRDSGFTLITAIFLLVVVASLSVYILRLSAVQQSTLVYSVQGARAMQAARAGIEWGIYESIIKTNCTTANPVFNATGNAISGFDIKLECAPSTHIEGTTPIIVYRLISTATTGTFGTLDYVSRRLEATISEPPP